MIFNLDTLTVEILETIKIMFFFHEETSLKSLDTERKGYRAAFFKRKCY